MTFGLTGARLATAQVSDACCGTRTPATAPTCLLLTVTPRSRRSPTIPRRTSAGPNSGGWVAYRPLGVTRRSAGVFTRLAYR
jgi:hypothetical protein